MSLIIEGMNGIGKTTFCEKMLKQSHFKNYEYVHLTDKEPNTFEYYSKILKNDKLILDRGPLSELVYSSIYGRKPRIALSEVNNLFKSVNCYVLWPQNIDQVFESLKCRGEFTSETTDTWLTTEYKTFWKYIMKLHNISIIPYNFNVNMLHYFNVLRG